MKLRTLEKTPIQFHQAASLTGRLKADALVVPLWKGDKKPEFALPLGKLASVLKRPIKNGEFSANQGEVLSVFPDGQKEKQVVLLGLGDTVSVEGLRRAYAAAARQLSSKNIESVNLLFPEAEGLDAESVLRGLVEGVLLADYRFDDYITKKEKELKLSQATLVGIDPKVFKKVESIRGRVRGVYLARDLVNRNADEVLPQYLILAARALEEQFPQVHTTVLDKNQLDEEGLGLLLAVGRGSDSETALIIAKYEGDPKSKDHTVVVGKGVTYDTGGLNLKSQMLTMKCDMGGAAACLGLVLSAASTQLKRNFTVVIPTTENAIGSRSYKPGDVYKSYSGKTVEIGNTDAEGRLILADALAYACKKLKPTRIIDLATLTGAMVVAMGHEITGLMSNDDQLAEGLHAAGQETYERVWRLPLIEEYETKLKSDIADLKNVAGREAGSIKAALFLKEFISNVPWAHLDIAGSAFLPEARDYLPKYATGVGVRLMMQYLENGAAT